MISRISTVILCLLLIVSGCSRDPLDVDVSEIKVPDMEVQRLDRDLFELGRENISSKTSELLAKYGPYYNHYIMGFIAREGSADPQYPSSVLSFVNDRDIRECQQYVQTVFPDRVLDNVLEQVTECARHFHYYFPEKALPHRLVTCLSGWNYAFAYMDSALVISLDMYLGDTAKFYQMLQYPQYQQRRMNLEHLMPDVARGWLLTEFDKAPAENTLLNHTIFYGKLFYAINALLPGTPDSLIIGYTGQQLEYCRKYEKKLWSYFAEKNRLYENDLNTIRELTSEGPFTGAISKECPPRIAMWVGWQVIRSYMSNNENVKLADLMKEADAQKILSKSRYRP